MLYSHLLHVRISVFSSCAVFWCRALTISFSSCMHEDMYNLATAYPCGGRIISKNKITQTMSFVEFSKRKAGYIYT